jgi:hypothetical protein
MRTIERASAFRSDFKREKRGQHRRDLEAIVSGQWQPTAVAAVFLLSAPNTKPEIRKPAANIIRKITQNCLDDFFHEPKPSRSLRTIPNSLLAGEF